jgi:hypothetical protein
MSDSNEFGSEVYCEECHQFVGICQDMGNCDNCETCGTVPNEAIQEFMEEAEATGN